MNQDTYQLTVINLLIEISANIKAMREQRTPLVYGTNPSLIDIIDHVRDLLQDKPLGLTIPEIYEGLQAKGVSFVSVRPENYLGTMLLRAARANNPPFVRSGYRYVLWTKVRIKGRPEKDSLTKLASELT